MAKSVQCTQLSIDVDTAKGQLDDQREKELAQRKRADETNYKLIKSEAEVKKKEQQIAKLEAKAEELKSTNKKFEENIQAEVDNRVEKIVERCEQLEKELNDVATMQEEKDDQLNKVKK